MFYEVFWSGYETSYKKFCKTFEKAIEIAKKYSNDEDFLNEYELNPGCSISKYEFDEDLGEFIEIEIYSYDVKNDKVTKESLD
ncbi:hypothetical protein ABIA69_003953 [Lysinibacillus parviboronicapiens]|uniref:Uncharacterized protein n=1 Tax=Lysinibacillus parviboronicapiens TaxID=436516 RepID=A0ABV2PP96_9BACI